MDAKAAQVARVGPFGRFRFSCKRDHQPHRNTMPFRDVNVGLVNDLERHIDAVVRHAGGQHHDGRVDEMVWSGACPGGKGSDGSVSEKGNEVTMNPYRPTAKWVNQHRHQQNSIIDKNFVDITWLCRQNQINKTHYRGIGPYFAAMQLNMRARRASVGGGHANYFYCAQAFVDCFSGSGNAFRTCGRATPCRIWVPQVAASRPTTSPST